MFVERGRQRERSVFSRRLGALDLECNVTEEPDTRPINNEVNQIGSQKRRGKGVECAVEDTE